MYGRISHCSVDIVIGEGVFMLEDAEMDPERDAELILVECVLQL